MNAHPTPVHGHRHRARPSKLWFLAGLVVVAVVVQGDRAGRDLDGARRAAIPFPSLVYDIEAQSGSHNASILNLGIGYVGAPQVPVPVDVNGDLLPDVTVAVNFLDTQGIHNPPRVGDIIRPNIEINRFPLELGTTLLGRPSPPLKITVALDVHDLEGETETMTAGFGYDTGQGGSIPGFFQATVAGLEDFFNPVTATISTKGDLITQSSAPLWYRGPLTVIGGFEQGEFDADLGLEYSPFPDTVTVRYEHDDAGDHIDYSHAFDGEVDLLTSAVIEDAGERIDVAARIDRLPRTVGFDMLDVADGGGIHFDTTADGRLPDVDVRFKGPLLGDVFDAHLAIEDLPTSIDAAWSLPEDGPVHASFGSSGQGIGAIEAEIENSNGSPGGLPPFLFTEKQIVAAQLNAATEGARVGARLERIRSAEVTAAPDGNVDADIRVGDGELPLELSGWIDLRDPSGSDGGPLLDATSVISPLPRDMRVRLEPTGPDPRTEPLKVRYEASEAVDVDARARVVLDDADTGTCGLPGVVCGNLRMRHIPGGVLGTDGHLGFIEARIGDFTGGTGKHEARIEVDTEGPGHVDMIADANLGAGALPGADVLGDKPLVAHAEVLGLAKHLRMRTIEGQDETLERAEFRTCILDYSDSTCVADPDDPDPDPRIGAVQFAISNFIPDAPAGSPFARPADLPPAYAATPNFATVTARGRNNGTLVDFEATGRMQDIREATYVNDGTFGVRTDIGGGNDLAALLDIDRVAFGEGGPGSKLFDVTGNVLVSPLPRVMSLCLNASGRPLVTPVAGSITAPCQNANPFDAAPPVTPLARSPLSVAYDGSSAFNVSVDAELLAHNGAGTVDDRRIQGHLGLENVPDRIQAHVGDPKDLGGGPLKVLVDADDGGPQLAVEARVAMLDGDLQCEDPRVPRTIDADQSQAAVCAQGRIENVPDRMLLDYDATAPSDNFLLDSTGEKQLDLVGLKVSAVTRDEPKPADPPGTQARARVLVAEGEILDLPRQVKGTLRTPSPGRADDAVLVDLAAPAGDENLVGAVNARVRNFIAPNPIPAMPAQRAGLPDPRTIGGDGQPIGDWASFIQRGDAFLGDLHISRIKRVGFKNQVTATGRRLDTSVVNVDFGRDKIVRGYVDLDTDGTDRTIGDATLTDIPAGVQVCFRGPKQDASLVAVNPTHCDTEPRDPDDDSGAGDVPSADSQALQEKLGAFELRMSSATGAMLDVDAFVRSAQGGGTDVLAARLDVDNIPSVVKGTFGDGKVDAGGFRLDGKADGIDRIAAHAASFDLPDDGWSASTRPYAPRFVTRSPFPAPSPANQHVVVRADDSDFEARARIGEGNDNGGAASDLHRIRLSDEPCGRPSTGPDYGTGTVASYGARPDFPLYPDDGSKYLCVRGDFKPDGPAGDPLELSVVALQGGKRLALRDGHLTDIPDFFQANITSANALQDPGTKRIRPHCVGRGQTQPDNCVAPLLRLDTPGTSTLSGVVEFGTPGDLARLATVAPREALPGLADDPGSWTQANGGFNAVRARIGAFDASVAALAGFRIPIPASFTLDQVQSWGVKSQSNKDNFYDASDLHLRYAARNPDGSTFTGEPPSGTLLKLSGLVHVFNDGSQILLSDDDPTQGISVPSELGIEVYTRNHNGNGRNFLQVDGRSSAADLDLRARMLGTGSDSIGRLDAMVRDVPPLGSLAYSTSTEPTFRIRAEILGEGKAPPDPDGDGDEGSGGEPEKETECTPFLCVETQVRLKTVNAQFDFRPNDGTQSYARLLEAVVRTDGAKNGVEVRGRANIDGSGGPGEFLAGAQLVVDPINVFIHAGIPFLGSFDFVLQSNLDAAVSIGGEFQNGSLWNPGEFDPGGLVPLLTGNGTSRFALRQNLLHMKAEHEGPPGSFSQIGPIDFNVGILHGEAWGLFVKLIGVDYLPPNSTMRLPFLNCKTLGLLPFSEKSFRAPDPVFGGTANVVAWPFFPAPVGNLHFSGLLKPVFDIVGSLGGPFFCLVDTDQSLIQGGDDPHPADPLGTALTHSTVPGALEDVTPIPTTPDDSGSPTLMDLDVTASTPPMCGTKTFRNVTVPNGQTLAVATGYNNLDVLGNTYDPVARPGVPAACPAPPANPPPPPFEPVLELYGTGTVTVNGVIQASEISNRGTGATGNGGGGHNGAGGAGGWNGAGGGSYGEFGDPFVTETGSAGSTVDSGFGSGGAAGTGGGAIKIVADVVHVGSTGRIRADGKDGTAKGTPASDCFVLDTDPGTDGNQSRPNQGFAGGGGGSGGGIVINVADYRVDGGGVISAVGGAGGAGTRGGGGGGGGGNVKVSTALRAGNLPSAGGGAGGADQCVSADDPGGAGTAGTGAAVSFSHEKKSRIDVSNDPTFGFWHSTQDPKELVLRYEAAAAEVNGSDDYQVVLCHTHRTAPLDTTQDLGPQLLPFPVGAPTLSEGGFFFLFEGPCGSGINDSGLVSSPQMIDRDNRAPAANRNAGTLREGDLAEGYHGFYTVLWKSAHVGNDCFNPLDVPGGNLFAGLAVDAQCTAEAPPTTPDIVLGIDNSDPNLFDIKVNGTAVTGGDGTPIAGAEPVPTRNPAVGVSWVDGDALSGVAGRECTPFPAADVGWRNCLPGEVVTVTGPDGTKEVGIRVIDKAGNAETYTPDVKLDTTVPASNGDIVAGSAVLKQNGWYATSPRFDLSGFDDFGGSGPGSPPYEYQFDDGDLKPCDDLPALTCRIGDDAGEDLPGIGRHRLRWTAIDQVGNRFTTDDDPATPAVDGRKAVSVKIDGAKPVSDLLSVPAAPNGANGWYSGPTWITFGAFDQPGASGFAKASDDPTDIGGVEYTTAHNGGPASAPVRFNPAAPVPVRLSPGTTVVCWQARDQAGNVDVAAIADQCRTFKVDEADPTVALPTTPDPPNGSAGWHTVAPVVDPTADDGGPLGSGVGTDTSAVCTQRPLIAAVAPTGTCLSIDGAPFIPVDHRGGEYLSTLGEGLHEVRAFATDEAGRRSPIVTRSYRVDLSNPVAAARTVMPRASAGKWWRHEPTVVLRAADGDRHGAGVARVRYQFSGTSPVTPCTAAPCTYGGPFTVPQGVYRVTYWAEDLAGRAQPAQTLKVAVDTTPAVPKATTPNPALWIRSWLGLPPTSPTVDLRWTLQENLSGVASADNAPPDKVNVKVVVYDVMGYPVRTLDAGNFVVAPGQTLSGKVVWDGKGANLTSLVPLGTYYYRVVATDAAGNAAMSGESAKLLIAVGLL